MKRRRSFVWLGTLLAVVAVPAPALAHDSPEGSEWVMADWMFLSFVAFAGVALIAFLIARRRGLLTDVEAAKYPMLAIDEPDYYTPEWAKSEGVRT